MNRFKQKYQFLKSIIYIIQLELSLGAVYQY